ncbi:Ig-like domain-containing protein [Shewanella sp. Sh95]|uniref:beta strand repeat-containing protein n=1 Tax=Shewanella sp. Sh95 TaxID=1689868 RepID=UPI001E4514BB|nr:Ig-like domain-containing protein [Shewanella sp. Sh95]
MATNSDGVATIQLFTGAINTGATVTAKISSGEFAEVNITMLGDGVVSGDKPTVSLESSNININAATPALVTAIVKDRRGLPLANKLVSFSLNDNTLGIFDPATGTALTNSNGVAKITLATADIKGAALVTALVQGVDAEPASLGVNMAGDGNTGDGSGIVVSLSSNLGTITKATPATLTATVKSVDATPLSNKIVSFSLSNPLTGSFNPESASVLTDANGKATIQLATANIEGAVNVKVNVFGYDSVADVSLYMKGDGNAVGQVPPPKLTLSSTTTNINAATPATVTATLLAADGSALANKLVQFSLSNVALGLFDPEIGSVLTDANGKASIKLKTLNIAGAGFVYADVVGVDVAQASLGVTMAGDGVIAGNKSTISLTASAIEITAATPAEVTALVKDKDGLPLVNKLVSFSLNDNTLGIFDPATGTALTNSNGVAKITLATADIKGAALVTALVQGVDAEPASLGVNMAGDGNTGDGSGIVVSLSSNLGTITKATPATLTATVKSVDATPLSNKIVSFSLSNPLTGSFNPESASVLTDANGKATIQLATANIEGAVNVKVNVFGYDSVADVSLYMKGDGNAVGQVPPPKLTLSSTTTNINAATPATVTATLLAADGSALANKLVQFSLSNVALGLFDPEIGSVLTDANGKASIKLKTLNIAGAGFVYADVVGVDVVQASLGVTMAGDGGSSKVTLQLTDKNGIPTETISTAFPGKLRATVNGLTKPVIVTFASPIGDLPVVTAVTKFINNEWVAVVDIFATNKLGAGLATASLADGDVGEAIVVVGATDLNMGSGNPFTAGVANVSTTQISAGGTASVSVAIRDNLGNLYTQPVAVTFKSTCSSQTPAKADLSSPVTTINGVAESRYLAKGCEGDDTINVSANTGGLTLSATASINVLPASAGSIVFVDATPENIGIKGTGGSESSTLRFRVLDTNGNPVANRDVSFKLNNLSAGLGLIPTTAKSNNEGYVQTVVNSGTVAATVRVTASIDGTIPLISSQSNVLVVSTGKPDQDSFSLSASVQNIEGWEHDGAQVTITARLADAFNNPVPDGTAVVFTAEGGAIDSSCQTSKGVCSVVWTSQNPRPVGVDGNGPLLDRSGLQTEDPNAALKEETNFDGGKYFGNHFGQPYGGRVTITATAIGEESFADLNSNNILDTDAEFSLFVGSVTDCGRDNSGDCYDLTEAFVDHNEDGLYTPAYPKNGSTDTSGDRETFIDFIDPVSPTGQGIFNLNDGEYSGVLCDDSTASLVKCSPQASISVRRSLVLVMSSSEAYATRLENVMITDSVAGNNQIDMVPKGTASVRFIIADINNQQMPEGTVVKFKPTGASVTSSSEFTWPSTSYNGGREFVVSLKAGEQPDSGNLVVTVTTPGKFGIAATTTEVLNIPIVVK